MKCKTMLQQTMVSERAGLYYDHLQKAAQKEKFKMCKSDILSDGMWTELEYVVKILEPVILFLRDNDGSFQLSDGNALGHAYYNFYQLDQYYLTSKEVKDSHRTELSAKVNQRWIFGHSELHSVGFVLHPYYRLFEQDKNPDVMSDFYSILDKWVDNDEKSKVLTQLCVYKSGKGHFSRVETKDLIDKPLDYWRLFGSQTPELQGFAVKGFSQATSASACESNWSTYEYIFSKRRNLLSTQRLEKLVYIHGNLRNIESCKALRKASGNIQVGSSLIRYVEKMKLV